MKELIILYGGIGDTHNAKQQRMINGQCSCGYRSYAKAFGQIIYLSPQNVEKNWEYSIYNPEKVLEFISKKPDAIVWSVKHDPTKDKKILQHDKNFKLYYSCCSMNMYNSYCNISLVDTPERMKEKTRLYIKGKDPEYWKPVSKKEFDYLLIGRRADKNELYFLKKLNSVKQKRKILWIGGEEHKNKVNSEHTISYTGFIGQDEVRDNISRAKVGILFTEHQAEGFPQSFLEMTMCGVPVVYNKDGPTNKEYFHKNNSILCAKDELISSAEKLLTHYNPQDCRDTAIKHYSLAISYKKMINE